MPSNETNWTSLLGEFTCFNLENLETILSDKMTKIYKIHWKLFISILYLQNSRYYQLYVVKFLWFRELQWEKSNFICHFLKNYCSFLSKYVSVSDCRKWILNKTLFQLLSFYLLYQQWYWGRKSIYPTLLFATWVGSQFSSP